MAKKVSVVEYGTLCNLYNVQNALEKIGAEVTIINSPEAILKAESLILPGVGAFADAVAAIKAKNLDEAIREYIKKNKPFLGICVGMQLLMERSFEFGTHEGMGIIEGEVKKFAKRDSEDNYFKVPNVGWLEVQEKSQNHPHALLKGITNHYFYHVHSYYVSTLHSHETYATASYADLEYCSILHRDNVWGCQFHPEMSGESGLKVLENFLEI